MTINRFRILSLDGGGVRGAYSASVLKEIEDATGKRIVDHFDLIAGTSTGGIIGIGLGLGLSTTEILDFYRQNGADIFPSTGVYQRFSSRVRRLFAPKYGAGPLDHALIAAFRDRLLGESVCRLVIPSYDAVAGDVHVFKTRHDARVRQDHKRFAREVARATSAAPTYLPMYASSWGQNFLDGGVWANCPAAVAVLEATAVLGVPLPAIQMLSVGTTSEPFSIHDEASGGGFWQYGLSVFELLQTAQGAGSLAQTRLLLRDRLHRIDSTVSPKRFALDDARGLNALIALGIKEGRHHAGRVAASFMDAPVEPFVPVP